MDRYLFAYFSGALLSLFLPIVPDFFCVKLITIVTVCLFFKRNLRIYSSFLFGIAWLFYSAAVYNLSWQNNDIASAQFFKQEHIATGKVVSLINSAFIDAATSDNATEHRFNFLVTELDHVRLKNPLLVRLNWLNAANNLAQGQVWQFSIKIKPAHGFANPGGFSYQTWLRRNNLLATGYISQNNALLIDPENSLRQSWFNQLSQQLHGKQHTNKFSALAPLIQALTFGAREQINAESWQVLQHTGTQHLIAISGLHIGLVATASFYLLFYLFKVLPLNYLPFALQQYSLKLNSYIFCGLFSCGVAIFYSYLAGFSPPTTRALIMLLSFWGLKFSGVYFTKTRWFLLTLCLIVLFEPMSLLSLSFWLSFYAVLIIFLILWFYQTYLTSQKVWLNYLRLLVLIQLGLTVFILPLAAFLQYQLSLITFFANLLAVPWLSFIVLPLSLLTLVSAIVDLPFIDLISRFTLQQTSILWQWLSFWSEQKWALINLGYQGVLLIIALLSLLLYLLIGLQSVVNKSAILAFLLLFSGLALAKLLSTNSSSAWQVSVLDLGHGLAVVVKKEQQVLLYDTGASYPSGFNLAESVIAPFLNSQGIFTLDKVYISHSDNDHAGGLAWLKQHFVIKEIISNDNSYLPNRNCQQGNQVYWQGLLLEEIWPVTPNIAKAHNKQGNDDSCVLRISDGYHQVLLTGDISNKVEAQLIKSFSAEQLQADVLIAPHHGSVSSSSRDFLQNIKPQYAIFSTGFLNRWQMPKPEVLARYHKENIQTFNTPETGAVIIYFDNNKLELKTYRQDLMPFWFAN